MVQSCLSIHGQNPFARTQKTNLKPPNPTAANASALIRPMNNVSAKPGKATVKNRGEPCGSPRTNLSIND